MTVLRPTPRVLFAMTLCGLCGTMLLSCWLAAPAPAAAGPPIVHVRFRYEGAIGISASMEPTIHCANPKEDLCEGRVPDLLLERWSGARAIRRGDFAVFHFPRGHLRYCAGGGIAIKRVIGLGGDRIRERRGRVYLNGRLLSEPYVPLRERGTHSGAWTVPPGSLFVAGDNRVVSCDSRYWGPLRRASVIGRVARIFRASADGSDPVGPPIVHVRYRYRSAVITSAAMEPSLHCARPGRFCESVDADRILVSQSGARRVGRGDIAWFLLPRRAARFCGQGLAFERVVGLPGERVAERRGYVFIDGKPLSEPYVPKRERDHRSGSWRVPENSYFLMADYRSKACDSRLWGPLPRSLVRGRVVEIIRRGH